MAKGFASKGASKGISSKSGGSRRSFGGSSSLGGRRMGSRPGGGSGGWSWLAQRPSRPESMATSRPVTLHEPLPEPELPPLDFSDTTWRDVAGDGGGMSHGVGQALGEGLVNGLGEGLAKTEGSAAFWKGVAVCALLVLAVVLVLYLNS